MQPHTFESDTQVQTVALTYGINMVNAGKTFYGIELDWHDESIRQLEWMAERMYVEFKTTNPPAKRVEAAYMLLGSYLGEVYRRNHGARWGWVKLGGERFVGMQGKTQLFWPWGRAQKRLANGPDENLWHYYQWLLNSDAGELKK